MTYIPTKSPFHISFGKEGYMLSDFEREYYAHPTNEMRELIRRERDAWYGLQGRSIHERKFASDDFFPLPEIKLTPRRIITRAEKDIIDDLYNDLEMKGKLDVLEGQAWCDIDSKLSAKTMSDVAWWTKCHDETIDPSKINSLCDICVCKTCGKAIKNLKKFNGRNYCTRFIAPSIMTNEYIRKLEILIRLKKEVIFIPNQGKTEFSLVL